MKPRQQSLFSFFASSKNPSPGAASDDVNGSDLSSRIPTSALSSQKADSTNSSNVWNHFRKRTATDAELDSGKESAVRTATRESNSQTMSPPAKKLIAREKGENGGHPTFGPISKGSYDPVGAVTWPVDAPIPFSFLIGTFDLISTTRKRLAILDFLCGMFRTIIIANRSNLLPAVYLCCNRLGPAYEGLELGVGDSILNNVLATAMGTTPKHIAAQYKKLGDLGSVAQEAKSTQKTLFATKTLNIVEVYNTFCEIAKVSGEGSVERKRSLILGLLTRGIGSEPKYIIRALQGKLRLNLAQKSIVKALGMAMSLTPPNFDTKIALEKGYRILDIRAEPENRKWSADETADQIARQSKLLKRALCVVPNFGFVLNAAFEEGVDALPRTCTLRAGIPVHPMLAQPSHGMTEILDRFGKDTEFTCEFKYDGERAQIHLCNGRITIYSRNLEDHSSKFPDVVQALKKAFDGSAVASFVMDCECVAVDSQTGEIKSFQVLATRSRKDVRLESIQVKVCLYAFDLMELNGEVLLERNLKDRRDILHRTFQVVPGEFTFATYKDLSDELAVQQYLEEAVQGQCEGLMVKTLVQESQYEPDRRSYSWMKIKKDYVDGMTDSFDLVPIAAYTGKGKRTGTYGKFLLACYDDNDEEFQSICKIGTGFSDEDLAFWTKFFEDHIASSKPSEVCVIGGEETPDVWLDPCVVWEISAADLSMSPKYAAAMGLESDDKGISLRFPRYLRRREDKPPASATTSRQIANFFRNQSLKMGGSKGNAKGKSRKGEDEDIDDEEEE